MTRTGKIARLPLAIREQLNSRLNDGVPGQELVTWLNGLKEVQAVLAQHFESRPVTDQNLSDWKLGGFRDWLREQDTGDWLRALTEQSSAFKEATNRTNVSDAVSTTLAVALGRRIQRLTSPTGDFAANPENERELLTLAKALADLRRSDHNLQRVRIERQRANIHYPANSPD